MSKEERCSCPNGHDSIRGYCGGYLCPYNAGTEHELERLHMAAKETE